MNTIDVIDNSSNAYIEPAEKLKRFFVDYLLRKKLTATARIFKNAKIRVLKMRWQDTENFTDCGIYAMRHMETYQGDPRWELEFTGVLERDNEILDRLRIKYFAEILSSHEINRCAGIFMAKVQEINKKDCFDGWDD
ncbi:OLC1v1001639C1 [Oldenlandia corymbosa var. corymbosa]|uniref:OLC1v1001639C1 n=1 Tax=Oldenlandia corymbosa var. corymbosa TaxID=529605 RepID=A0AAV1D6G4_OLDCO|nr:OLC1v1001639C1 [Oldenlandia corymbosa var. corymbosa]